MAQHSIGETNSLRGSVAHAPSLYSVLRLRMTLGLATLLGSVISFLALSWDIQWHIFVGRDRTLTAPHVMLLSGIVVSGIATLAAVIIETLWMKQHKVLARQFTPFAGIFAAPLGAYIAGYAALNTAVAFPLDQYWHTLYGIDVTIWAPFHIMVIGGLALTAFGAAYTLASVANLAKSLSARKEMRIANIGMVVAFAVSLAQFTILASSGIDTDTFINLGFTSLALFPMLSGLLLGCLLLAVAYAAPWKWAASSVVGVAIAFMVIDQLAVPPAMTWLMQVEQLSYLAIHRSSPPQISVVAITWPVLSLLSAILIDFFVQRARKQSWSKRQLSIAMGLAVFVGCIPLTLKNPGAALNTITSQNILGILLTLAACCLGIFIGMKLGQSVGETLSTSER